MQKIDSIVDSAQPEHGRRSRALDEDSGVKAYAHSETMTTILFLCYFNAGRSQMAEAFFNAGATQRGMDAHAESAGILGVGSMQPMVLRSLEAVGFSAEGHRPKQVTRDMISRAERVISFGRLAGFHSPIKFVVTEEWPAQNPAGLSYGSICAVRDEISVSVDELLDRLARQNRSTGVSSQKDPGEELF